MHIHKTSTWEPEQGLMCYSTPALDTERHDASTKQKGRKYLSKMANLNWQDLPTGAVVA